MFLVLVRQDRLAHGLRHHMVPRRTGGMVSNAKIREGPDPFEKWRVILLLLLLFLSTPCLAVPLVPVPQPLPFQILDPVLLLPPSRQRQWNPPRNQP